MNLKYFVFLLIVIPFISVKAQSIGDTIKVQAFTFDSETRDTMINFPQNQSLTFEKIILKYTMRCKNALVSDGNNRNKGCGEWDYSCNTYIVDSSKIESIENKTKSHIITNFSSDVFPYKLTEINDFLRDTQKMVVVLRDSNLVSGTIGSGLNAHKNIVATENQGGRSLFVFKASELQNAGISAGEIDGLTFQVLGKAGDAQFFKIRIKNTNINNINEGINFNELQEVFFNNVTFQANLPNNFQFHTPFIWDGFSNVLVELSFNNRLNALKSETEIAGDNLASNLGVATYFQQNLYLANNSYVEIDNYKGIQENQDRTIETFIRTNANKDAEICSWGSDKSGEKWVFRLTADGKLRVEINGGGVVSKPSINDGKWHHVACVLEGNTLAGITFYVDGLKVENSEQSNLAINTSNAFNVRISRGINNRYLDAEIDELKIWDQALTSETIMQWMHLKPNSLHPNINNLQVYYDFDANGVMCIDHSGNQRNGKIIGSEMRTKPFSENEFIKGFSMVNYRPSITFLQGDYHLDIQSLIVDKPIEQKPLHFVIRQSIQQSDSTLPLDDIVTQNAQQYWIPKQTIYDNSGKIVTEIPLIKDGEITISDLTYKKRYPFYNELLSFVTPYGIGLDLGKKGKTWYFDMTDYTPLLEGNKRLLMTLGGQWQEEMDLEFLFIVGTPPRNIVQYEQIWQGTNRLGNASIDQIINNQKFAPKKIDLSPEAQNFKLRSTITGHGAEGEFEQNGGKVFHRMSIDETQRYSWELNKECSFNPIYPQGGTWLIDRQGWCPGERSLLLENDFTSYVFNQNTALFDYQTSNPPNPAGDYRYHVAHQIVGYGPANHQNDASVIEIIAPNNSALYTRIGQTCSGPQVTIQNTGSNILKSLKIEYWVNEAMKPQEFNWTGSLGFMETMTITLPSTREMWMDIKGKQNKFYVRISNPNNTQDEYEHNNTMESFFDIPELMPRIITVEVKTNNRAIENSYKIIDENGLIFHENNLEKNNFLYRDTLVFPDGCYKLIFEDEFVGNSGQDGLEWWANPNQGSGSMRFRNESNLVVKIFDKDFGGGFEYSFTTNYPLTRDELKFLINLEIYPNPSSHQLNIKGNDLENATLQFFNAMGQEVKPNLVNKANSSLNYDLIGLSNGIYFIKITKNNLSTTRKFIKQ